MDFGDFSWIAEIAVGLQRLQLDCEDCSHRHAVGLTNCICKLPNLCNLSNPTAIPTIRLQYSQSMNRSYHVVHIGVHIPECVKHPALCLRLQSQQSDCNLSNQTAISTIQLQSLQSNCNLCNPTAIQTIRLQSPQSDCNLYNQ